MENLEQELDNILDYLVDNKENKISKHEIKSLSRIVQKCEKIKTISENILETNT